MKLTPVEKPQVTVQTGPTMKDARDRAVATLKNLQQAQIAQPHGAKAIVPGSVPDAPVANPTSISPEEMSAIVPPSQPNDSIQESAQAQVQSDNTEQSQAVESSEAPKAPAEKPLSSQYAQLARKEKALRQQDAAIKAREAALAEREKAFTQPAQAPSIDSSKYISAEELAKNPFQVLSKHGITYEQLTQEALNAPSPEVLALYNKLEAMEAKFGKLEEANNSVKKGYEESQTQAYNEALRQMEIQTKNLVKLDPAYEMIKHTNSYKDVVDLIKHTYEQGLGDDYPKGTLLDVEQAAAMVEEELVETATKLARSNKIQQRLKPAQPASPKQQESNAQKQPIKTLTNAVGTQRQLTAKERAVLAFKGERN